MAHGSLRAAPVAKLKQLIVERRTDLWWYYHHSEKTSHTKSQHLAGSIRKNDDPGKPMAEGHISPTVWRDGLVSVLQLQSVPLMSYRPQLAELQPDGSIDYNRFLNRYVLVQDDESHSGWQAAVVKELYEAVLRSDLSLRETFAFFDHDGMCHATSFPQQSLGCNIRRPWCECAHTYLTDLCYAAGVRCR